jgi:hypothetical protein
VARACLAHGRFAQARSLLGAAGAWPELLALCVFQGDFLGLQSYARQGGREVQALADQLAAVNEEAFRRAAGGAYGGRPNTDDWRVHVAAARPEDGALDAASDAGGEAEAGGGGSLGAPSSEASDGGGGDDGEVDLEVAPAGRLPYMEGSLRVSTAAAAAGAAPAPAAGEEGEEGQPIPRLDMNAL